MGFPPFSGDTPEATIRKILSKSMSINIENNMYRKNSKEVISFINGLLEEKMTERLGMASSALGNIKEHSFFGKSFNWHQIENGSCENFMSIVKVNVQPLPKKALNSVEMAKFLPNIDEKLLKTINQNVFKGFDYVDESFLKLNSLVDL